MSCDPELEAVFPNLLLRGYKVTSAPSEAPNCVGWALHDVNNFWTPHAGKLGGYYWPPGFPKDETVETLVRVFELYGYRRCESADLEDGIEKIAIYAEDGGLWSHATRQLPSGAWASKLGVGNDIEHQGVGGLAPQYGAVVQIMQRPRRD
jgi:hypothetical protein